MEKSAFSKVYSITTAALVLTFMVSCTKSNQSQSPSANGAAQPTATNPTGTQEVTGTTDGAGGNGLNGKAYESYIVDPTQLPPYKNILAEKMQIMNRLYAQMMKEEYSSPGATLLTIDFAKLFKLKKWYLAPVSLKTLSKSAIGVDIFSDPTQQLALQTDNEVWIDSRPYNDVNRTEKERADLILHEYFMSYLLILREPYEIMCRKIMIMAEERDIPCDSEGREPRKPKVPLTKQDYEKVRAVTATVMAFNEKTTVREYKEAMEKFSADGTKPHLKVEPIDPKNQLKPAELVSLLKAGFHQGLLNGPCYGASTKNERKNCTYELKISDDGKVAQIVVKDVEKNEVVRNANIKLDAHPMQSNFKYGADKIISSTEMYSHISTGKEGDFVDQLVLFTSAYKDSNRHQLVGIALKKFVIFSSKTWKQDGSEYLYYCVEMGPLKPVNIYDDTIILTTRKDIVDQLSLHYINQTYSHGHCNSEPMKAN